eukprot:2106041-Prymnesium_polylepis.2
MLLSPPGQPGSRSASAAAARRSGLGPTLSLSRRTGSDLGGHCKRQSAIAAPFCGCLATHRHCRICLHHGTVACTHAQIGAVSGALHHSSVQGCEALDCSRRDEPLPDEPQARSKRGPYGPASVLAGGRVSFSALSAPPFPRRAQNMGHSVGGAPIPWPSTPTDA